MTGLDPSLAIFIGAGCLTSAALGSIVTYLAVNWNRDRQAESDDQRREMAIEHGLKLAQENQELEKRTSGEQPVVTPGRPPLPRRPRKVRMYDLDEEQPWPAETPPAAVDFARWAHAVGEGAAGEIDQPPAPGAHTCGWSDDGVTVCGAPAVGWVHLLPEPAWLCAAHYQWACHGADAKGGAS